MLHETPLITIYSCFLAAVIGACMGSFLNCMAWRIVHGESVVRGRSHCDECGHALSWRDLVPVFSYVFSRGRCRYCGKKLSSQLVWAEVVSAAVFTAILLRYDISLQTLELWLLACLLLASSFADLEGYIIPDRFILVGICVRLVFFVLLGEAAQDAADALLGGFAVGGGLLIVVIIYERVRGIDAMGGGDIKLLFLTGLFLGWKENILCLLLACIIGVAFAAAFLKKRGDAETPFPWGPSIAAAAFVCLMCGDRVISFYLGLF